MGTPTLEGPKVPTTLAPTHGSSIIQQDLVVDGKTYKVTCVSMGNPHAVIYTCDGKPIKVSSRGMMSLHGHTFVFVRHSQFLVCLFIFVAGK